MPALVVRWLLSIGLVLAVTPTAAALAQPAPLTPQLSTPIMRREVRIGVTGLPAVIDPAAVLEGPGALIAHQVFDTLVAYREGSTDVEPALATRWSVSRDGLVWTFVLRDSVRFHDGTALTATEVVTSFERQYKLDPQQRPAVWSALLRGIPGVVREVRAADPRTVVITVTQPYAPLLTVLAHPGFGIVRPGTALDGSPRLVGSGPFRLAEVVAGRITLDAVPAHWSGGARTERLVFLEVASDEQAEADLDSGALDVWFPPGAPRRVEGTLSTPGVRVGYLAFQTEKEPFTRKKVRQALAAAIDPAVVGIVLGRAAVPLQSFLPPAVWARREGSPILGGAKETVVKLLAEGGWPKGFSPVLVAPSDTAPVDVPKLAEALQLMLQGVDIQVRLRLESEATAQSARTAGEHDITLAEASVVGGDPHLFLYPLSTSEGASRGPRALNYSFYRNPRLDDVLIRASQLAFRPERLRLYHRAQAMLADEVPWIPLYVRLEWAAVRREVRGLRLHPTGLHRLATVSLGS
jgi:peptide/nickel transport system substrate-binding protein